MAHEELKALYEIDKQHSDDPDQYWEFKSISGDWIACYEPGFYAGIEYRRKPDAPVWPVNHEAEDARRWKEAVFQSLVTIDDREFRRNFLNILNPKKPTPIQGYTEEQWQRIIDGKFLCEFSDCEWNEDNVFSISTLTEINQTSRVTFSSPIGARYGYCRPLRIKGVRQPWFGGECPIRPQAKVIVKFSDGSDRVNCAGNFVWVNSELSAQIVEFIEL